MTRAQPMPYKSMPPIPPANPPLKPLKPLNPGKDAGARRYDTIVFLLIVSLVMVVAGGAARYVLVDRPAAKAQREAQWLMQQLMAENQKNQQQLEQKLAEAKAQTEALRANVEQMKAEIQLPKAAAEPVPEPAPKPVPDAQALERKRLERVKVVDELVDSLAPNLQVKFQQKVTWLDRTVSFDFSLTNAGRRAVRVTPPRIALTLNPLPNTRLTLKSSDVQADICPAGLIGPGETINCHVVLRSEATFTGVGNIPFRAAVSARTDLPATSETWKTVRSAYKEAYLEERMVKSVSFNGELWR
ncbi:hypothetical protein [Polaromonas sp.]|uniref:hypothetical protein n=1 Tax=Polaromonas sp. TaxID=1869339 RepID=UPI003265553B